MYDRILITSPNAQTIAELRTQTGGFTRDNPAGRAGWISTHGANAYMTNCDNLPFALAGIFGDLAAAGKLETGVTLHFTSEAEKGRTVTFSLGEVLAKQVLTFADDHPAFTVPASQR